MYCKSPFETLQLTKHLFNDRKDLFGHFSEALGLITCKSFQSSGSLDEITDVKLSGINILYRPFLFKLLFNMWRGTNNQFVCTHFFSLQIPFIGMGHWLSHSSPMHWPRRASMCVHHACILTPCSHCPGPFLPPLAGNHHPTPSPYPSCRRLLISPSSWFPPPSRSRGALLALAGQLI